MLKSDELENKRIGGNVVLVRNKSKVTLNGLAPGSTKHLKTNAKGVPLDKSWRKALTKPQNGNVFETVTPNTKRVKAKAKASKSTKKGDES